jgi:hypothetical protein
LGNAFLIQKDIVLISILFKNKTTGFNRSCTSAKSFNKAVAPLVITSTCIL